MSNDELPHGYKSAIELIDDNPKQLLVSSIVITTGTSGTEIGYYQWKYHSNRFSFKTIGEGFNVVLKAKKGRAVFLAGQKGRIAKLIY